MNEADRTAWQSNAKIPFVAIRFAHGDLQRSDYAGYELRTLQGMTHEKRVTLGAIRLALPSGGV